MDAFSNPRWEDYEYTHVNSNPFGWFGNGWTLNEINKNINVDYLNDENIDYPLPQKVVIKENGHAVEREEPVANAKHFARL